MVLKMAHVVLLASFKYLLTVPYTKIIGLTYSQALIAVLLGGIGGFLFFYYVSNWLIGKYGYIRPYINLLIPGFIKRKYRQFLEKKSSKPKKIFSGRNRLIVKIKRTYGFWGIIIMTPVLLTFPVGAFLASKYYSKKKNIVGYMVGSITAWAFLLTTLIHIRW